jgi:hypothetical protein
MVFFGFAANSVSDAKVLIKISIKGRNKNTNDATFYILR